ncbi:MAG: polysaccharide biosynthesis tyrosine autokinase [Clostridiales bacterium]|nr:polysaccharide biosynthesis tyrosine autokinase [Clostridiales bacterium]
MIEWFEYLDNDRCVIHFGALFKLLLKYVWVILLVTLLAGGGAFVYATVGVTPLYQSSIKMYVNNSVNAGDSTSITSSDLAASQTLVNTYAVILTSYPTLSEVIDQTGVDYTYEELCGMVTTTAVEDTGIFSVTVTSSDPFEAAEIANAIAEVAPDKIMDVATGSSVKVVEYARVATEKCAPSRKKYALLGAAVGFVLSCGGVLLLSLLRNGMSVEEKIQKDFKGSAALSVIPLMGDRKRKLPALPVGNKPDESEETELCETLSFASGEAYKLLRENIGFCFSTDLPSKLIGVTSSMRSEGKSTTAINLAYTLALTKKKVCLVDCDLRLPSVSKRLKLHRKPGMTNCLVGQAGREQIMQEYKRGRASFFVITSGDAAPNPSELLGSNAMRELTEALREAFDYVIFDLPPVGIVSDALVVAKYLDGTLFAVREDFYERKKLRDSLRALEMTNTKFLGLVITHSTAQRKEYRTYGYGYEELHSRQEHQPEPLSTQKEPK